MDGKFHATNFSIRCLQALLCGIGFLVGLLSAFKSLISSPLSNPTMPSSISCLGESRAFLWFPITFNWKYISSYIFIPSIAPWHAITKALNGILVFLLFIAIRIQYTVATIGGMLICRWVILILITTPKLRIFKSYVDHRFFLSTMRLIKLTHLCGLSTTFFLEYGLSFACIAAVMVHTAIAPSLSCARTLWVFEGFHTRHMRTHKELPDWWYAVSDRSNA